MDIILGFLLLLIATYYYTYPKTGAWLYRGLQQWQMVKNGFRERSYRVNGIPIVVLENESQPIHDTRQLLILVHDFPADKTMWLPLASKLSERFHVVIPDLPGFGETGYDPQWDFSLSAQVKRLGALIWQMGYSQAHIVGQGMGADIGYLLAREQQRAVASLTLIAPMSQSSHKQSLLDKQVSQTRNPFFTQSKEDFYALYNMATFHPPRYPGVVKDAMAQYFTLHRTRIQALFSIYWQDKSRLIPSVSDLDIPVQLCWGRQDSLVDISAAEHWCRTLNIHCSVINDTGHYVSIEAPMRLFHILDHFYASAGAYHPVKMPARIEDFYRQLP